MSKELTEFGMNQDRVDLIKRTFFKGSTDDELKLFLHVAAKTGLDPMLRQIYAVKRWDSQSQKETTTFQTSIDGLRLIAERSGKYAGQLGPYWCGDDGVWKDVWISKDMPTAAKVGILRNDFKEPLWGVAKYQSYYQTKKDKTPNTFWTKMADVMVAKVAESLAIRKAFPQEVSGLYSDEEMDQAGEVKEERALSKSVDHMTKDLSTKDLKEVVEKSAPAKVAQQEKSSYQILNIPPANPEQIEKIKEVAKQIKNFAPVHPTAQPEKTIFERMKDPPIAGEYRVQFGKFLGMEIKEIKYEDMISYINYIHEQAKEKGRQPIGVVKDFLDMAESYLASIEE